MRHPEQKENEVFISNETVVDYFLTDYSSKRLGNIAYDVNGKPIPGYFPLFVKTTEYDEKQKGV